MCHCCAGGREEAEKTRNAPNILKMATMGRKKGNGLEEKKAAVMFKVTLKFETENKFYVIQ